MFDSYWRGVGTAIVAVFLLASCTSIEHAVDHAVDSMTGAVGTGGPTDVPYRVGKPYEVNGVRYVPREDPDYNVVGIASWYGRPFHGHKTASGQIYNMNALTAAHPTLPFGTQVRVTNLANHKSVVLTVNDRGPFSKGRIIDVSRRAAERLGFRGAGTARVRVEVIRVARG